MSLILKATLDLAQSRKSSKAGVIARSSSRRVASSTAKNPGESLYFTSCDQSGCLGLNYLAIEIEVNLYACDKLVTSFLPILCQDGDRSLDHMTACVLNTILRGPPAFWARRL